jgi:uncharacterized membrane protein
MEVILALHLISTVMMTGIIWFVQVVHYPLFAAVGEERFAAYEALHQRLTGRIVVPWMVAELATAIVLVFATPPSVAFQTAAIALAVLVLVWCSTFFLQVPAHRRLEAGFNASVHRRLVLSNWLRTMGWSVRTVLAMLMCSSS